MPEPKRDIKDSVFTFLFSDIEYTKQLYLSLHPEDTDIRDEDFRLVTLENILAIGQYNDLGFQVRDKLILLVEAQSTFSPNIPLRMLMYLAKTYNEYIEEHQLSLYREKKVSIPPARTLCHIHRGKRSPRYPASKRYVRGFGIC